MIKTYSGSGREETIWQYLGSVLSRSLFLWILFAQGVAWTEAAQTVEKTVSKNSNLGAVFSAEGYLDPLWALVVTPVIHWQHASCVIQTEFGWVVDTAGGGCAEAARFKCATMAYPYELQFQGRVFKGKLEPCDIHELPPPNGSGGSENTGWKITARTMGYQVLPEQATICVNQTASFYTTDLQGNLLTDPSNWTLTPQVGGAPTGPYPPGTSVFVPSITPGVPGVYKVKGTSTETGESDTATLTIFKVEMEIDDDVVVRYSTNPAGRPTIPCRARVQGLGSGSINVVLKNEAGGGELRFSGATDTTKTLSLPSSGAWVAFNISGQVKSTVMNDAIIEARLDAADGPICAETNVTVLWVDNYALRDGQDDSFSADNDSQIKPDPALLGSQSLVGDYMTAATMARVVEIGADVNPSSFDEYVLFTRDNIDEFMAWQVLPAQPSVVPDNTHSSIPRGATSGNDPTAPGYIDGLPSSDGRIYSIDTPGHQAATGGNNPQGTLIYVRYNFLEYAIFNGVRCSDDFAWFARVTTRKTAPLGTAGYAFFTRIDHMDDNSAGPGATTMDTE